MTVEWTELVDCPELGPDLARARPLALEAPVAMRQGSQCAVMGEEGAVDLSDAHGLLAAGVGLVGLGAPVLLHRTPALCVWSWQQPEYRIEQVLLLSARPAAAILQWRVVGTMEASSDVKISVVGPVSSATTGRSAPLGIEPGTPATFAVWRPPSQDRRRQMLERVLREPAALWKRWATRREAALRVDGFQPIAGPIDFALAMLPTLDGERFWIGTREGRPAEGSPKDRVLAALALAGAGRFQEAAELRTEGYSDRAAGADSPHTAPDLLPLWTGIGESEADPGSDPLLSTGSWSELVAPAIEARRAGNLEVAEDIWMDLLSQASRRGGWTRPGWDEHAGEAAAAVALFVYDILGSRPDAAFGRLRLAPALPASVDQLTVDGLQLGRAALRFEYRRTALDTTFGLHPVAGHVPMDVILEPLLPAQRVAWVEVDGEPADVGLEPEGDHIRIRLQLPLEGAREVVVHSSPR